MCVSVCVYSLHALTHTHTMHVLIALCECVCVCGIAISRTRDEAVAFVVLMSQRVACLQINDRHKHVILAVV